MFFGLEICEEMLDHYFGIEDLEVLEDLDRCADLEI